MKIRRITTIGLAVLAAGAIAATATGLASAAEQASATPGTVVIVDAQSDPQAAKDAMSHFPMGEEEVAKDHATFIPTTDPTYGASGWKIAQYRDRNGNLVDVPAIIGGSAAQGLKVTTEHTEEFSATVGGSIELSRGFNLVGVVDAEVSVKFTASHTWSNEAATSQGIWFHAAPGKTVVLMARDSTATFSGTFQWKSDGVGYVVKNVEITQPAAAANSANGTSPTNYLIKEYNTAQVAPAALASKNSIAAVNSLPKLQELVNTVH